MKSQTAKLFLVLTLSVCVYMHTFPHTLAVRLTHLPGNTISQAQWQDEPPVLRHLMKTHRKSVSTTVNINFLTLTNGNCVCAALVAVCATAEGFLSFLFIIEKKEPPSIDDKCIWGLFEIQTQRAGLPTHPLLTCKYKRNGPRALGEEHRG